MTDYPALAALGVTVWTLEGQYDLWSMQHPDGRHKDEYEGQWVKAEDAASAIEALQAEVARLRDGMEWISRRVPDGMPLLEAVKDRPAEVAHDTIACARYHARGQAEVARLAQRHKPIVAQADKG